MRLAIAPIVIAIVVSGCAPGTACSCESGPLPGEFEPCTEDLRCADGLACFSGGGECLDGPPDYAFCARPCGTPSETCSPPNLCMSGPQPFEWNPFPVLFCRAPCSTTDDCPTGLGLPWWCSPSEGACAVDNTQFTCPNPDAGVPDAGPNPDAGG